MMGTERKSLIISEKEKRITSYHECGTCSWPDDPEADRSQGHDHSRGRALGLTTYLPIDEKHTYAKKYLERWSPTPSGDVPRRN